MVGQLAKLPLLDDEPVATDLVIGPNAEEPLKLDIPLFVSDMSFGTLSEEAAVEAYNPGFYKFHRSIPDRINPVR